MRMWGVLRGLLVCQWQEGHWAYGPADECVGMGDGHRPRHAAQQGSAGVYALGVELFPCLLGGVGVEFR